MTNEEFVYQESLRKIPKDFNWFAVLKDLRAGRPIEREEWAKLSQMAGNWITCACGQLCQSLPRNNFGCPRDGKLAAYGTVFYHDIESCNWSKALQTMHKIEARTMELLERQASSNTRSSS
jgi:hypothetical protein